MLNDSDPPLQKPPLEAPTTRKRHYLYGSYSLIKVWDVENKGTQINGVRKHFVQRWVGFYITDTISRSVVL